MSSYSILIVDDEPMLALDIAYEVETAGYRVAGPATNVASALELVRGQGCDAAILDVNLGREDAGPIAQVLKELGIPFIVVSGYARAQQPAIFANVPFVAKPVCHAELMAALEAIFAAADCRVEA